jgi:hypothetical protein
MPSPALLQAFAAKPAAAGGAWSPADLSPVAWYIADQTGQSSGAHAQWDDLSGNGHHQLQATSNLQPDNSITTLNSRPVMRFVAGATPDVMTCATGTFASSTATILYVMKGPGGDFYTSVIRLGGTGDKLSHMYNAGGNDCYVIAASGNSGSHVITINQWNNIVVKGGASFNVWQNGVQKLTASGTGNSTTGNGIHMNWGAWGASGQTIDVAEVVCLNGTPISDADRGEWDAYVTDQWGV